MSAWEEAGFPTLYMPIKWAVLIKLYDASSI